MLGVFGHLRGVCCQAVRSVSGPFIATAAYQCTGVTGLFVVNAASSVTGQNIADAANLFGGRYWPFLC